MIKKLIALISCVPLFILGAPFYYTGTLLGLVYGAIYAGWKNGRKLPYEYMLLLKKIKDEK